MRRSLAVLAALATSVVTLTALAGSAAAADSTVATPLTSSVVSSAPAPGGAAGTTWVLSLPYGGLQRSYRLFVPTALPAGPRPLVLMLHGLETTASWMELRGTDVGAAAAGTLVAYPEGIGMSWNSGTCCGAAKTAGLDDVGFLAAIIADVKARMLVDAARVAIGGASDGGVMSYRFGCDRTDLVSALYIVASVNLEQCAPSRPVSLMHLHGQADPTVPYLGTSFSTITGTAIPAVADEVLKWAAADSCGSTITTTYNQGRTDVPIFSMDGCPAGISVQLVRSKYMTHTWPVTATDISKTGVDPTAMLWPYLAKVWAGVGTPAVASTVTSAAAAPGGAAGRTSVVTMPYAGTTRTYRLFVPNALPAGPRPLVVLLHAAGSNGSLMEQKGTDIGAGTSDALVAYPDAKGTYWPDSDTAFVAAVIADVTARMLVDTHRVVVGGHATGGTLAYLTACERSDLVTGVFAVATAIVNPTCARTAPLAIMHVHGLADTTALWTPVSATLNSWATAFGCGPTIATTNYQGRTDVFDYRYSTCPAGTSLEALRSKSMTHSWPVTATEIKTAGVAPSTLLWTWLQSVPRGV
jgi:polyhydroxybutyrate depolymerase